MGIQLNTGFSLKSKAFLDERDSFESLSDMKNYSETNLPDGFITYNKETNSYYKYNSTNDIDTNLGRWREHNNGEGNISYMTKQELDNMFGEIVVLPYVSE